MSSQASWNVIGGIKNMLSQIETTHTPRPETDEKIVELPRGLDKLRSAIVAVQGHIVEAQSERATINAAEQACLQDIAAAKLKNEVKQGDLHHRMYRLQEEWAKITRELGIRAEVPPPAPINTLDPANEDGA